MNNLPISNNNPQPSGNAANTLQAIAADNLAMDAQPAGPFAFLLARQIGGTDLSAPDTARTAIAIDGNATDGGAEPATKDAQDPVTAAGVSGDPANMLAAILLQLSAPEDKGQKAEGMQATQSLTLDPFRKTEGAQATQSLTPVLSTEAERQISATGLENSQLPRTIDPLSSEVVNRAESPAGPAQPTPNAAQAAVPPAASAVMQGTLTNTIPASTIPTIAVPLGNNGWAEEFSQKISWIATQQNQIAELHLNPPNLGPLDVVLKISDNQATALFASPHGAVRDAVENALPKLREILADNGIMLGNTTISDQSPRDRSMDGFMNQGFGTAAQHGISDTAPEPSGSSPAATQTVPVRRHNGMVDTFA